jgi:hypothetical protein
MRNGFAFRELHVDLGKAPRAVEVAIQPRPPLPVFDLRLGGVQRTPRSSRVANRQEQVLA